MSQCWEEQGEWLICRGAGCKLLWCGTVAAALCSISCPMLGVKNSSCVAQAVSLKGNQGWMRGCSLCLGYRDGAWWGYGVTGHRGWSPSLCRCVQQPCEYSGCVLSPDAATQCANLFQICQGVGGKYERLSRRNRSDTSPVHSADSPVTCQQMALTFTRGLMAGTKFLPATKKLGPSLLVRISCSLPLSAMQIPKKWKKK